MQGVGSLESKGGGGAIPALGYFFSYHSIPTSDYPLERVVSYVG